MVVNTPALLKFQQKHLNYIIFSHAINNYN